MVRTILPGGDGIPHRNLFFAIFNCYTRMEPTDNNTDFVKSMIFSVSVITFPGLFGHVI